MACGPSRRGQNLSDVGPGELHEVPYLPEGGRGALRQANQGDVGLEGPSRRAAERKCPPDEFALLGNDAPDETSTGKEKGQKGLQAGGSIQVRRKGG